MSKILCHSVRRREGKCVCNKKYFVSFRKPQNQDLVCMCQGPQSSYSPWSDWGSPSISWHLSRLWPDKLLPPPNWGAVVPDSGQLRGDQSLNVDPTLTRSLTLSLFSCLHVCQVYITNICSWKLFTQSVGCTTTAMPLQLHKLWNVPLFNHKVQPLKAEKNEDKIWKPLFDLHRPKALSRKDFVPGFERNISDVEVPFDIRML